MASPEELLFLQSVTGTDTHATQRHVSHSIAERLSRLARTGPQGTGHTYVGSRVR